MEKYITYQNQESFVPQVALSQNVAELPKVFVSVLTEADLTALPAYFAEYSGNTQFAEDLKKGSLVVYGQNSASFTKVLALYVKEVDAKKGYKTARSHLKSITSQIADHKQVTLHLSSNLNQDYLSEYAYGLFIENYQWQRKSSPENGDENSKIFKPVESFNFVSTVLDINQEYFKYISTVAASSLYGRELINTRANIATTNWMAEQAETFAAKHSSVVSVEKIKGDQLLEKGLTLMHAVGRASSSEPQLVILNYKGNPEKADEKVALVGKGVVYDCGGLSLKQVLTEIMHADKGGACSVLAAFKGIVELGLKVNVVCTLGLVENMIGGNAYRVSDIIKTYKGLNVEVLNTDAEGRNVLADALAYTQEQYKPHTVFDVATLTGACLVALGNDHAAIFSNDEELGSKVTTLSKTAYENLHPLPITEWMRENIQSDQGDIRNLGKAPYGGSGTAAAFLECFIEKGVKWAHIDMAQACGTKGELMPVRTIIDYCSKNLQ